ncbi:MAG: acyltransferase domain-containing protein, partial [Verrucomicrobiota bacterium]
VETECIGLFSQQYALAKTTLHIGPEPDGLLGHSFGEIAAACIGGVFDLETAVDLVCLRSRLMDASPKGGMLAVACSPDEAAEHLANQALSLAAHNAPGWITISGPPDDIDSLESCLKKDRIASRRLPASHAFHSADMDPVVTAVVAFLQKRSLEPPSIPMISGVTGTWLTEDDATSPEYWGRQLRKTVQFNAAVKTALEPPHPLLVELGGGRSLIHFATQHHPHPAINFGEKGSCLEVAADLWRSGVSVHWSVLHPKTAKARRIPLPTYPFERSRYWVAPGPVDGFRLSNTDNEKPPALDDWFYHPSWKQALATLKRQLPTERRRWLVFTDEGGVGDRLARQIEADGEDVLRVSLGSTFSPNGFRSFSAPDDSDSLAKLLNELHLQETPPDQIVFFWPQSQALAHLAVAIDSTTSRDVQISVITTSAQDVIGEEPETNARQASLRGLAMVIGQEYPNQGCRIIDLDAEMEVAASARWLWRELGAENPPATVACRSSKRWVLGYEPISLPHSEPKDPLSPLRKGGTFFIVGDAASELAQGWAESLSKLDDANVVFLNTNPSNPVPALPASHVHHVNGGSRDTLEAAVNAAIETHGPPRGVFVGSPTTNEHSAAPLALLSKAHWCYNEESKTALLEHLAAGSINDSSEFVCVQSSMSAVLGGIGLGAYSATNVHLDRLVNARGSKSKSVWVRRRWSQSASMWPMRQR